MGRIRDGDVDVKEIEEKGKEEASNCVYLSSGFPSLRNGKKKLPLRSERSYHGQQNFLLRSTLKPPNP